MSRFSIDTDAFPNLLGALIQRHHTQIDCLLKTSVWTWDNLIMPLEEMEDEMERFFSPLAHLQAVMNSPDIRECYEQCLPKITAYHTKIGHNKRLFKAIESIPQENLTSTQSKIIQDKLRNFRLSGVALSKTDKKLFEKIQTELALLEHTFETHILEVENQFYLFIEDEERLKGIPHHTLQQAAAVALEKGYINGYCLTLAYPCYQAVITYAQDRSLREAMYHAYTTRASDLDPVDIKYDNTSIMASILQLRQAEASLLGFKEYASLSLATKMLKNPQSVLLFLEELRTHAKEQALAEFEALTKFVESLNTAPSALKLEAWDIAYYSQLQKQTLFTLNDEALRPYFPLDTVLQGLFSLVHALFNVRVIDITPQVETWHPEVRVFELSDEQQSLGQIYVDLFARPNKRNGAWMNSLQGRRKKCDQTLQLPIATLTCNFTPPLPQQVATLLHDDVITLFHEFGHCLHHVLTQVDYLSASGMNGVEWDAVELPSQVLENWCWTRDTLNLLSRHVETQTSLPESLFQTLYASKNHHAALNLMRQIQFAIFDFELHLINNEISSSTISDTLTKTREKTQILPLSPDNRFAHSFSHIFAGGYAAGYYSYLWAEVLSSDVFSKFETEGLFNAKLGHQFLTQILAVGSSCEMEKAFQSFMGRPPSIAALLRQHGVNSKNY